MNITDFLKKMDDAMENLPEEVIPFLFDGEFDLIFDQYKEKYTDQEKFLGIKNKTLEFILGVASVADLKSTIDANTENKQIAENIKKDIQEKIINELILILDVHTDMKKEGSNKKTTPQEDVVSRLGQVFVSPKINGFVNKSYINEKPIPENKQQSQTIDPYREIPEK